PIDLVVAGGQEDDRGPVAGLAQPAADLGAVGTGEPDVQHAGDRAQPARGGQAGIPVVFDVDAVPVAGQIEAYQLGDGALVLNHEHQTLAGPLRHVVHHVRGAVTVVTRAGSRCVRAPGQ